MVSPRDPPEYAPPLRRCEFGLVRRPEPDCRERAAAAPSRRNFYCEECCKYKEIKDFLAPVSLHPAERATKHKKEVKRNKKVKMKADKDGCRNTDITVPAIPTSETVVIPPSREQDSKTSKEDNEFSDHSDTEYGFGPLPESVFEAIEDSQDNQSTEDAIPSPEPEVVSDESNPTRTPIENTSKKVQKKSRTCPICSKVYTASSSYFYHMKYTHRKIKEHECTMCAKKFATRASLASHVTTHTGECHFECKKCKKCFRSKASLYIHEQTHSGVKTWCCSQCKASFRWKTHLLRHMKRHSSEKSHVCSTCGRGFNVRCDLLRHARTHVAGNFACEKCNVKFAQMRYLKVHMDKKHTTTTKSG